LSDIHNGVAPSFGKTIRSGPCLFSETGGRGQYKSLDSRGEKLRLLKTGQDVGWGLTARTEKGGGEFRADQNRNRSTQVGGETENNKCVLSKRCWRRVGSTEKKEDSDSESYESVCLRQIL